jgi:hypothetical protein
MVRVTLALNITRPLNFARHTIDMMVASVVHMKITDVASPDTS